MIASEKKDVKMIEILLSQNTVKMDLNMIDQEGKTGFIYSCMDTKNDQELRKKAVQLFLDYAQEKNLDLTVRDKSGKSGEDYLPNELRNELFL